MAPHGWQNKVQHPPLNYECTRDLKGCITWLCLVHMFHALKGFLSFSYHKILSKCVRYLDLIINLLSLIINLLLYNRSSLNIKVKHLSNLALIWLSFILLYIHSSVSVPQHFLKPFFFFFLLFPLVPSPRNVVTFLNIAKSYLSFNTDLWFQIIFEAFSDLIGFIYFLVWNPVAGSMDLYYGTELLLLWNAVSFSISHFLYFFESLLSTQVMPDVMKKMLSY